MNDPIVDEVRAIRAQIAEECQYDLNRIAEHARETAAKIPGLRYVTLDEINAQRAALATSETKRPQKAT